MAGFPDTAFLVSNADPNDPAAVDNFTDLAPRNYRVSNAGRGKQYELGQSTAGTMNADLLNIDEALNPANASSPLVNIARLMRRVRWMCMYPRGGTGNLLNPTNPLPAAQGGHVQDGSFESYAAGPAPAWILKTGGVTPTVTATNPQQGIRCLTFGVVGNSIQQGVGYNVATIPGRTYTAQVQVRSTAANTMQIFINGAAGGTTSAAVNTYTQLAVTFVATQPVHQVWLSCFTPTLAATVNVDAMMTEPGGTASPFTTTGPRIRGLWGGHVSGLPVTWEQGSNGYTGIAKLSAVGPLAALAQIGMKTDYAGVLAAKKPDFWWPLWGGPNATVWAEGSGNNGPPLTRVDLAGDPAAGPVQPVTFASGTAVNIAGDPGASGVAIGFADGVFNHPVTIVQTGWSGTPKINLNATGTVASFTVVLWASWGPLFTGDGLFLMLVDELFSDAFVFQWSNGGVAATPSVRAAAQMGGDSVIPPWLNATPLSNNVPHQLIATVDVAVAGTTVKFYVDGVLVAQSGVDPSPAVHKFTRPFSRIALGAAANPANGFTYPGLPTGLYTNLAIWKRVLSAQDVTDLWNAGKGYAGETTGARLSRLLGLYYVGPSVLDTGRTTLNPSGATDGTKLGQVAQRTVDSELGNFKENRDGALEFDGRDDRSLNTVPKAVFGENVAGGEIPYRDAPLYGYDLTQVTNQVTVTQTGGTKASAADAASQKSYYQRSTPIQTDTQSGLEVIDYGNWLVANRAQPKQRIEKITLDPGANPSLWPTILDLEIGQRYTIKRNARAANGGAGLVMTGDYFLENVAHRQVDHEKGTWLVDLILSPVPLQPWILGDPVYGQLGITTVLGF